MARIIRLTEKDLTRLVKRVIKEQMEDDDTEPQLSDFGMEPLDNTRFDDKEYMADWEKRFRGWVESGKTDEHGKQYKAWWDRQREKKKKRNNTQSTDLGMEPLDNTRLDDEEYIADWENRFMDWVRRQKNKKK